MLGSQVNHHLKMISLNIETDRHFERFIPFILKEQPDIILFQEIFKRDVPYLEQIFHMHSNFVGLNYLHRQDAILELGIATFSKLNCLKHRSEYYRHARESLPIIKSGEAEKMARAILVSGFVKGSSHYCVINTHFTWAPDGKPSDQQFQDLEALLALLAPMPEFILCGDFNAPRGTSIFDILASRYQDNIPKEVQTTIDPNLHRAGSLNLVVDGLFTTSTFQVVDLKVVPNVSDHCAIVATLRVSRPDI